MRTRLAIVPGSHIKDHACTDRGYLLKEILKSKLGIWSRGSPRNRNIGLPHSVTRGIPSERKCKCERKSLRNGYTKAKDEHVNNTDPNPKYTS